MNWISNYVKPKINAIFSKKDTPGNLWHKCEACGTMLFHRELADSLRVCNECGHHMYIPPQERLVSLFDGGVFNKIPFPKAINDPLHFKDSKKYSDRLRDAQKKTGNNDAMVLGVGNMGRMKTTIAVQDFNFMAGSMGMAVGNAIIAGVNDAIIHKTPLILFSAAGGARMQESILALMQMPRSTTAIQMLREKHLPYIVILTNPTTGGVTASYAMLGDVQIAEPNALIWFAGPRVIEQTIREKLPEGFQRAEYLLDHGMLDRVIPRKEMRTELIVLLHLLMKSSRPVRGDLESESKQLEAKKNIAKTSDQ